MYTIYGANLHNEENAAEWFQRRSPASHDETFDIGMFSEVQKPRARRHLRNARRHTYFTGPPGMGGTNAGQETGLLLADDLPNLGGGSFFIHPDRLDAFPHVGQERWSQVRLTRFGKLKVALINIHPTPKPATFDDPDWMADANYLGIYWAGQQILIYTRLQYACILGVDINVKKEWETSRQMKALIDRHHLKGAWVGRDLLMATPPLKVHSVTVRGDVLHDHPLMVMKAAPR